MKLKKLIFVFSLFLSAVIFQNESFARSEQEVKKDLDSSTDAAAAIYKQEGMSGLMAEAQRCYKENTSNQFYCVYFDLASRRIDQVVAGAMNFPPTEFFADEQFGSRVGPVIASTKVDMDTANKYLVTMTTVINQMIEKKM